MVDYAGIKANAAELKDLVSMIGTFKLSASDQPTQKAFLINAYNILVIKNVVDHYPIAKPTDVTGFFDAVKFNLAGTQITLSDIENKKIRAVYKDPRTHFALVCAAKSCPPIANYAFTPTNVEAKLEAITKAALNNTNFIKVQYRHQDRAVFPNLGLVQRRLPRRGQDRLGLREQVPHHGHPRQLYPELLRFTTGRSTEKSKRRSGGRSCSTSYKMPIQNRPALLLSKRRVGRLSFRPNPR